MSDKPIVAIVGRPNVGKSTLFNRLIGRRLAIVEDLPGTTRDRLYADVEWRDRTFTLVDTAGLLSGPANDIEATIYEQVHQAIAEADVVTLVVDATAGSTVSDDEVAEVIRRSRKPVVLAANKADNERRELDAVAFYELGLGDPIAVSALHATGTGDLLDAVYNLLPPPAEAPAADPTESLLKIAIVGRPNVGKSALVNALLGQERVVVSDVAGTTRDAIDTLLRYDDQEIVLIDTAGIRRPGRVEQGIEKYSVMRSLRAVGRANIALLLIDAEEHLTGQDSHIAGYVWQEAYKGLILVVNKWDLIEKNDKTMQEFVKILHYRLKFLTHAPIVFVSAKYRQRLKTVLQAIEQVREERFRRVGTGELNAMFRELYATHTPPTRRGKSLKVYYVTQAEVNPPTFVFFVNDPEIVHFSDRRQIENYLRRKFGFHGTPIRLRFRGREER
ncbi:MAG TPA: ribosome biogenesis GTPase Der [Dehalococcoidia bacterium]|nr:ribosome biogenesis GTPase Der [Dehalococcoidia bacterium]